MDTKTKCTVKNVDYFETIDTKEKSYMLGLMLSDGCVTKDNRISISQSVEHAEILNFFGNEIGFDGFYYLAPLNAKGEVKYYPTIHFSCRKMFKDLGKLNVVPAKTLKLRIPRIDKDLMSYMLLGVFDGDGCIHYNGKKDTVFQIAGTKDSMLDVCDYFKELGVNLSYRKHNDANTYIVYCYKKEEIKKIYDLFYKSEIGFKRKKEGFERIIHDFDLDESSETRFEYNIDNRHVYNSYIVGVILGNGNFLSDSRFKINRGKVDNLDFKKDLLKSYIIPSTENVVNGKLYSVTFRSKKLRYLYDNMTNILSQEIINRINEYSLGILYLDKGTLIDRKITISNLKYSKHDNERICAFIKKKYNVEMEYSNESYYLNEDNTIKFLELIREVIILHSNHKTGRT